MHCCSQRVAVVSFYRATLCVSSVFFKLRCKSQSKWMWRFRCNLPMPLTAAFSSFYSVILNRQRFTVYWQQAELTNKSTFRNVLRRVRINSPCQLGMHLQHLNRS